MAPKIAYIVSRFPKISETFILNEILDLERRGLQIEVFSFVNQKESKVHTEAADLVSRVHYTRFPSWSILFAQIYWLMRSPSAYLGSWWKAVRGNLSSVKFLIRALAVVPMAASFAIRMQKNQIQHVHAHWATHSALAAYVIKQLTGLPYSITAHAQDIYVNQSMLGEKLREAEFIVTISDFNRKLLAQYGPEIAKKIHVIHCGINPDVFHPSKVQPHDATRDSEPRKFTILCVASLNRCKGHSYLIEACSKLKEHGITFRCILIGEGDKRKKIERQIKRLGLGDRVELLGLQKHDEVLRWIRSADVMVLPSVTEGIPVVLMEALAMEIPVIATSISGIPELIEHGKSGLLVPKGDSSALAAALLLLYREPAMGKEMALFGRAKVLNEFNLHINSGILYQIFCGLPDKPILNYPYSHFDSLQKQEGTSC